MTQSMEGSGKSGLQIEILRLISLNRGASPFEDSPLSLRPFAAASVLTGVPVECISQAIICA
eukprot:CAMPEP_0113672408 /NCGR_PEP_ID=MMETSP0038_2-20120614/6251_1 /TAXON_ID=2898 /ORGANISM="Cryptomonas paramecium" /LENGTH=61 /DNA_ID=CAMNT_0000588683 /DNA_START=1113 /DNA_END=1294 /DNA_ORIENTATION=+ /assembly_acc=CAM_ASM_000170